MQSMLEEKGYKAGFERVRRLMRLAYIRPIYPRKHLTPVGRAAVYLSLSAQEFESGAYRPGLGHN
jgi:hypothetical protein